MVFFRCERCGHRDLSLQVDRACPLCHKRMCSNCWCYLTETCDRCALVECEICGELHPLSRVSTCEGCGRYPVHDRCMTDEDFCENCTCDYIENDIKARLIAHKIDIGYSDEVFEWLTGWLHMSTTECWNSNISQLTDRWINECYESEPENREAIEGKIVWLVA